MGIQKGMKTVRPQKCVGTEKYNKNNENSKSIGVGVGVGRGILVRHWYGREKTGD